MNRSKPSILLLVATTGIPALQAQNADKINSYLRSLKYNPKLQLAVPTERSQETIPVRTKDGTMVVVCTTKRAPVDDELTSITIASPAGSEIFPGALVRVNQQLALGTPDLVGLPRAPVNLTVNLPNLKKSGSVKVDQPALSTVQPALQGIEGEWFKDPKNVQAAQQTFTIKKAYSSQQVALALGVTGKVPGDSFSIDSKASNATRKSTCIALFRQVYYTASVDPPANPAAVFDKSVKVEDLKPLIDKENPAIGYVKSVDYGRIIMVRMDTNSAEEEADLVATMTTATQGVKVQADVDTRYASILKNSTFTVTVLGGNAKSAAKLAGQSSDLEKKLYELIQKDAALSKQSPASPIGYTVNFLNDNRLAKIGITTEYTIVDCKSYPQGFVTFRNEGLFDGRFWITWMAPKERDDKFVQDKKDKSPLGTLVLHEWASDGWKYRPFVYTQYLPGDATDLEIFGEAHTGLKSVEMFREKLQGPPNKCYRLFGYATNPQWDNNCK
jgi:thiol-activated cytolysin